MTDQTLFPGWDPAAEEAAKVRGMALAAEKGKRDLALARAYAGLVASRSGGLADIDGVRAALEADGQRVTFGAWAGSVFKGPRWEPAGVKTCSHPGGHGRLVRVWRRV